MNAVSSPSIFDALQILFHLLYFIFVLSATSLVLEKVWIGPTRWTILPVIALSLTLFCIYPGLILRILNAVVGPFSPRSLLVMTGSGMLAGMAGTSL